MSLQTFSPPLVPSPQGSSRPRKARVNIAQFGDGYSQRSSDGLNTVVNSATWAWAALSSTDFAAINNFLIDRGGKEAFLWTAPGDSTARQWTCAEWTEGYPGGATRSLTATFQEVFDL